jgi:hypothetical protein
MQRKARLISKLLHGRDFFPRILPAIIVAEGLLPRGHADGGFPAVEGDPGLGEVVVVDRCEQAGDEGKSCAGSKRALPHRLAVRRVFEEHRPVAGVVSRLYQPSQQAGLSDDEHQPV